ncbi:MAG TPA: vWA domain-containing protein [Polyangiaceae bacterium]|nr:vWA domain-containing protein [Polyangiaceae bacterium]
MRFTLPALLGAALAVAAACSSDEAGTRPATSGTDGGASGGGGTGGSGGIGTGGSGAAGTGTGTGAAGTGIIVGPSADSGAGPSDGGGCASSTVKADLLPSNLLFVIDRSGSMNCNLPPVTSSSACEAKPERADPMRPSKWEIIRDALKSSFASLPSTASAGISYFSNDDECGVQSAPSVAVKAVDATQIAALNASLDAMKPAGGTPVVGATILGYKHLHQQLNLTGNDFLVLLTDGSESCTPADVTGLVSTQVPNALSVGIRTFSIGVPGSEAARGLLSQIAFAGDTARSATCDHSGSKDVGDCHFDMTTSQDFAGDLRLALGTITGKALTCTFEVPPGPAGLPVDRDKLNVNFTPGGGSAVPILQDNTAPCDQGADGWQYTDSDTKITLCGPTCAKVKSDSGARIEIVLGCRTVIK